MRYFPGIVLLLLAVGIFFYNGMEDVRPINIPFFKSLLPDLDREARGALTWQLLGAAGVLWIFIAGLIAVFQPKEAPDIDPKDRSY